MFKKNHWTYEDLNNNYPVAGKIIVGGTAVAVVAYAAMAVYLLVDSIAESREFNRTIRPLRTETETQEED